MRNENMGTTDLPPSSSLHEDYKELRIALRGLSCNEKKVIEILGRRNQAQRDSLAEGYELVVGESLQKRLRAAISGKLLQKCLVLWMMEPSQRDAVLLHKALRAGGLTRDCAALGMLCTRTSAHIYQIKQAYYTLFSQTLESHMDGSSFRYADSQSKSKWAFWKSSREPTTKEPPQRAHAITKLLLALARGSRPASNTVDRHIALTDAHHLNKVCTGKLGNEETLISIFTSRSPSQLTATLNYYQQHYGHDFEKPLRKKGAGEFLQALRIVVQCLRHPSKFHAEELAAALPASGPTDEETLIRIITTRAEVDMQSIKMEFTNECKRSLEDAIANQTAGNFRQFLLTVINQRDCKPNCSPAKAGAATVPASNVPGSTASTNTCYHMSTQTSKDSRQASDGSQNGSASYFSNSVGSKNSQNSL